MMLLEIIQRVSTTESVFRSTNAANIIETKSCWKDLGISKLVLGGGDQKWHHEFSALSQVPNSDHSQVVAGDHRDQDLR